jgi:hypothetical protein
MFTRVAPTLIALWVVVHVLSTCVSAVPDPRFAMKKSLWKDERVQSELDTWAAKLGANRDAFEDVLWNFGTWATTAHAVLDAPFVPYSRLSGNRQRWPMFGAGSPESDRLEVRARACPDDADPACVWQLLYRTGSTDARFLADVLEAPRVRSLVSKATYRGYGGVRKRMCRAVAYTVLSARLDLNEVECSFMRHKAPKPGRDVPLTSAEQRERAVLITRAQLGPVTP